MKEITNNPYRIIGILSNATAKEIQARKSKITAYAKVAKQITSEFDFPFLEKVDKDQSSIEKSFSAVQQSKEMLNHSLFWFIKTNSFDDTAINYLINGDKDKAAQIWEKVTSDKEVTSKNFSCFNNLGTLKLLGTTLAEIQQGIDVKAKLIESMYFKTFVELVAGDAFLYDSQSQLIYIVDKVFLQLDGKYAVSSILKLFKNCNDATKKYISEKFTEAPFQNIETAIERTKKKRNQSKIDAFNFGNQLHNDCKSDLELLKSLIDVGDLKYQLIADNLAKEIMQCGIDYFNESQDQESEEDYLEKAMQLNQIAISIAAGKLTKDRAKDHITTLEEIRDNELSEAVTLLESIKELYIENEKKIRAQIKKLETTDIDIILGRSTINTKAVEDNIKNSIQWEKVNDRLKTLLSDKNLVKIRESNQYEKKQKLFELMHWLKEKSTKSFTVASIIIKYNQIPPKLPFKIICSEVTNTDNNLRVLSSEVANTDNKIFYKKFIRYIALKLELQVLEEKSVTFYLKYIFPNGRLRSIFKTSPTGYTMSNSVALNLGRETYMLKGWGNSEEGIFETGKHKIEVYFDDYLIQTVDFEVVLAPIEKLEIELRNAEKKLSELASTTYYQSEIKKAENDMIQVKEWHFLRTKSDREQQIKNQQKIIDAVIRKSVEEKNSQLNKQQLIIADIKAKMEKLN
jgi:hypothetical protein